MGLIAAGTSLFIVQCAGGGDEVLTGVIPASAIGYAYCSDGKVADRAIVKAVAVGSLPNAAPQRYFSHTDSKGRYEFSSIPSGDYNIYCIQDSLRALSGKVRIAGAVTVPNDTLKVPGRIDGTVRLAGGEDCRTVLIMVMGGDSALITGPYDTSGIFTLDSLAEGNYRIRFMTTYSTYTVLDTACSVLSGKSTDIGTIILK